MTATTGAKVAPFQTGDAETDAIAVSFARQPPTPGQSACAADTLRVPQMRKLVAERLRARGLYGLIEPMTLVTSELVTNAIRHGSGESVSLLLACTATSAHLVVNDGSTNRPTLRAACIDAEAGRGLYLVASMADEHNGSWGFSSDNTFTWCTLANEPAASNPWRPHRRSIQTTPGRCSQSHSCANDTSMAPDPVETTNE